MGSSRRQEQCPLSGLLRGGALCRPSRRGADKAGYLIKDSIGWAGGLSRPYHHPLSARPRIFSSLILSRFPVFAGRGRRRCGG
ncbi:hypothetical protein EVAR_36144_1 [Eumeta japonica]|uniref:Uncharacterized protein n=1 Tax=Eumeta variegata TaxID=151549 RepID=A0A4C1X3C5_EUMVA|nr:hypothetical protein EVAR_36144_1 [Eumeta japonica]